MKIAILGGGRVGSALAATWTARGHDVAVSQRGTLAETAASGEVVVLSLPARVVPDAIAVTGPLDGKILMDATNNPPGGPSGLEIAALVPGARYVKALNTVFSTFMHEMPPERPASLLLCGDDEQAKQVVATLVADLGFDPVDAGGSDATPLLEAFTRLLLELAYTQGRGPFVYRFESR
jgi:8-hydroxy-5-deazaflavin:NADPH oxidoreductase